MSIFSKSKPKEQIEQHRKAEIAKGLKLISSQIIYKNHILWEYDAETGHLQKAPIEKVSTLVKNTVNIRSKVVIQPSCKYFSALNRENAIKKLNKFGLLVIDKDNGQQDTSRTI